MRKGQEKSFNVTLGELPAQREAKAETDSHDRTGTSVPRLGLTLAPAGEVAGSTGEGVVVTDVEPTASPPSTASRPATSSSKSVARRLAIRARCVPPSRALEGWQAYRLMRVKSGEATKFVAVRLGQA